MEGETDLAIALEFACWEKAKDPELLRMDAIALYFVDSPKSARSKDIPAELAVTNFNNFADNNKRAVALVSLLKKKGLSERILIIAAAKILFREEYTPVESVTLVEELSMRLFCLVSGRNLSIDETRLLSDITITGSYDDMGHLGMRTYIDWANLLKKHLKNIRALVTRHPLPGEAEVNTATMSSGSTRYFDAQDHSTQ